MNSNFTRMNMLQAFNDFIAKEHLFTTKDHLLLAVSGGLDSVVLCELCHRAGYDFTMAHCNFQLRGDESRRDETFVRQLAAHYNRNIVVKQFDTSAYAAEHKLSIQVAARELRYNWFREVATTLILTAHHLDDNIETLLMNFFKGTGITGLRAMLPRQGDIVRPLLFTGRSDLHQFALEAGLSWVEDSSNLSDKYTRNYFRHQVIPLVQQAYPSALQNMAENINRFRDIEMIYRQAIGLLLKKLIEYKGKEVHVPVLKLKKSEPLVTVVYELITPFGFSPSQTDAVIDLLDSGSGKYISSATHRILKDRNWLIISPLQSIQSANILIEAGDTQVAYEQGALRLHRQPLSQVPAEWLVQSSATPASGAAGSDGPAPSQKKRQPPSQPSAAFLDAAAIHYPLLLRKWRQGDYFYPLGMQKKKKLARFLIDNKLSLADKEKVWVLEMDKKIVWIVGLRIDNRFRIGPGTKEVVKVEWLPA